MSRINTFFPSRKRPGARPGGIPLFLGKRAFGQRDTTRNTVLIKAFKDNSPGWVDGLTHIGYGPPQSRQGKKISHALLFTPLRWAILTLKYLFSPTHDYIFVPFPAYIDGCLGCLLGKIFKKKVIIDALVGVHDTLVVDRNLARSQGMIAKAVFAFERKIFSWADLILTDTKMNAGMFQERFDLPAEKFRPIPVGIDETLWRPVPYPDDPIPFKVIFWSTFIPLHGAEVIIRAAQILNQTHGNIIFHIIGDGQTAPVFEEKLSRAGLENISWDRRFIPLEDIQKQVEKSHCCLGVFGTTAKTDRVLPFKAYQALASARPLVTARTTATQALLAHGEDGILVKAGDPEALASALIDLSQDPPGAARMGQRGRKRYEESLSHETISQKIGQAIESLGK